MPLPFANWSLEQIRQVLADAQAPNTGKNRKFMEGDHWQGGDAWKGPRPDPGDANAGRVMELMELGFCSENAIKECVERHASGTVGHEPAWGFTPIRDMAQGEKPTPEEQALIDEIEAFLTEWWNNKGIHSIIREALEKALWARHGPVRCFVPSGRLESWTVEGTDAEGNKVPVIRQGLRIVRGDIQAALRNIFVESPDPEDSAVIKDITTQAEVGITRFGVLQEGNDPTSSELEFFELTWIDEDTGFTVFRIVGEDGTDQSISLNLAGYRTTESVDRPVLITNQVIQSQTALNTAITLSLTNLGDATYLERTFLNARMPGHEEDVEDPVTHVKRKVWVRDDYVTGPGAVNFIHGEPISNPDGTETLASPQLIHKPPTPLDPVIDTAEFYYVMVLREVKQTHILKNEEGRASGKSHEQARVDYNISLNPSKDATEEVGRWVLGSTTAWAELISGVSGKYTSVLRPFFECQLDTGPVSQDERSQNRQDVEAGLMDDETAMARAGILDVDKTKAIIAARPEARLRQLEKLAGIVQKSGGKVPMSVIAKLANFSPEEVSSLEKAEKEVQDRADKETADKTKALADAAANRPGVIAGPKRVPASTPAGGNNDAAA